MIREIFLKSEIKNTQFICSVAESCLKIVKCLRQGNAKREFVSIEAERLPAGADEETIREKLSSILKKLEYKNNPVIVSLPRNLATCRNLKIPSHSPEEIERIISLQAPRYLPYSAEELITAYQVIETESSGYSCLNLIIVHKDVVIRLLNMFKELKPKRLDVFLSSYGLRNLYNHIGPQNNETTMLIDIDLNQAEAAVVMNKKIIFSRSFKLNFTQPGWENLLVDEVNKSRDVYSREPLNKNPVKVVVFGGGKLANECVQILNEKALIPAEALPLTKINFPDNIANKIPESDNSFASLIGLGLEDVPVSLSILPIEAKAKFKGIAKRLERLKMSLFLLAIVFIWGIGTGKNLDNKAKYLQQLKVELSKVSKEAKPLEEMDKRLKFMEARLQKRPSSLEVLSELYKIMPPEVSLKELDYQEDSELILRGESQELNPVFSFVSQLEKSDVFKPFSIKIQHVTKNKTSSGEINDFEIIGRKE